MKRQTLVLGVLSLATVASITSCVDDKYDLSDIDTTSRFTVDNLTVPVPLSEIKLENVINLDDNDLIEKVMIDGRECYSIVEGGDIAPKEFSIDEVDVTVPLIRPTDITVGLNGLVELNGIVVSPGTFIPVAIPVPPIDIPQSNMVDYAFKMDDVPDALLSLKNIKTSPIKVYVTLSIPNELIGPNNEISFTNLKLRLPQDLIDVKVEGKNNDSYDPKTGDVTISNVNIGSNGKATVEIEANGLNLGEKGEVIDHKLAISGSVGVLGGKINLKLQGIYLPESIKIDVAYEVLPFTVKSFSGKINYNMDAIHIDPISLNDLPDFLDNPETNIKIANPQILVNIKNPVGKWLEGKGKIILTSNFKNGTNVSYSSDEFTLKGNEASLAFCTEKPGVTFVPFDGLRNVLSNGDSGLPSSIEVDIQDINFAGDVEDFPLGNLGNAEGSYEFNAPLGFGVGSMVIYETTEDGWGGDDLDDVNITKIHLKGVCSTNLPVSVQLTVVPVDKDGKEITVKENSGLFKVPAKADRVPVELLIESVNGPIKDFDGVKFRAVVNQDSADNVDALGPDLYINLGDVRVTVDGYYETEF